MPTEKQFLVSLLVKIGIVAAMASILVRWNAVKRLLLGEQRTLNQRLQFGLWLGGMFSLGVLVRLLLGYQAADLSLEGALVAGLLGGYVTGSFTGLLVGLPAFFNKEILALPLMVGVGALGGFLRELAPDPEEVWRFSPFFDLNIYRWFRHRRRGPSGAFHVLLLFACVSLEFLRVLLGHLFTSSKLFYLYPQWQDPLVVAALYLTTVACVALPLKVWNNTRTEIKLEEQRRLLLQAKLESLSSQINPHFLFNTLNSVASLIRSDQETARVLVFKLSTILRRLLRKHDNFSPLRDELDLIEDYLSIEMVRFGDKLKFVKQIEESALDALIPSMMLQPILENSIKHGLSPQVEGGTIWLRAGSSEGRLTVTIEDDGVGIPPEAMSEIYSRGIGVSNVRERLAMLFGQQHSMNIGSRPGGGTRVEIRMPELRDTLYERQPEALPLAGAAAGIAVEAAARRRA
ncbi:MAG: histidine kinase [Acidobacteria bacterium]|nr:histidine kinase [Acidobacteriota bacterium]